MESIFSDIHVRVIYPEISFKCDPSLECSVCCKIAPADLNEDEYNQLIRAGYRDFAYPVGFGIYLMKKKEKGCIFLKGYKCKIHNIRPVSCRAFPFTPAFFDFYDKVLVCVFDPKALKMCKGIDKGRMENELVYECALACRKLFIDRIKMISKIRKLEEAFLLAALSTPKKIGMIRDSPWRSQCYCCGHPLKISGEYKIYKEIQRNFIDYGEFLVCERCLEEDIEKRRRELLFSLEVPKEFLE
uniref:YkgJ family cysteine cluster protein n=1 Tax=Geoglobus ahangari TaxID=113653 RepID=A0A7C3UJY2_9EURY